MARLLCLHGHFYQPPRENPWTESVPVEPSAAPFHDALVMQAGAYQNGTWVVGVAKGGLEEGVDDRR